MVCQASFAQGLGTIMPHLSPLRTPQATGLALGSCGMVLARSCALTAVSHLLAKGRRRKEPTVRQQLREWSYDIPRTRGAKRQALPVETCVAPLRGWVVSGWQGTHLALAMDATTWGQRVVGLAVSVVYRGWAIPVAWGMLPAGAKQAGRRAWLRLFRRLHRAIPRPWTVIGLADRGVYAPWLLRRLTRVGWHPFLRRNTGGSFRPANAPCWQPFLRFVPRPGTRWRGTGIALTRNQVPGTLLARWEEGDKAPWLLLTALAPEASDAGWYGLRAGIAQGCKMTTRAGWPGHRTRRQDPDRAARLWLAVAVATLGLLSGGESADEAIPVSTFLDVMGMGPARLRTRRATRLRLVRVLRQGWVTLVGALLRQAPVPQGRLVPELWPLVPPLEEVLTSDRGLPRAACKAQEERRGKEKHIIQILIKNLPLKGGKGGHERSAC
jgi:hypothetical protein